MIRTPSGQMPVYVALPAGHGFINDPDLADATPLLIFLAKISGTRYHEPSAQDARRRIAAFFREHLKN